MTAPPAVRRGAPGAGRARASWPGRARRALTGEAGPGAAWALAAVSLLIVLIAVAGPRELSAIQNTALRSALARLPALNLGITAQATWQEDRQGSNVLPVAGGQAVASRLARSARSLPVAAGGGWTSVFTTPLAITNPAPRSVLDQPPTVAIMYRSDLPSYARTVSGTLPAAATALPPGPGARHGAVRLDTAVTTITASRLGLHVGSQAR
ncbi:MAG TPA: hypothetical protein VFV41_25295, partial [Streptosporangiaceae bacterium]|nr:hypothetical protein [Streptosporangiaceae bacterium]